MKNGRAKDHNESAEWVLSNCERTTKGKDGKEYEPELRVNFTDDGDDKTTVWVDIHDRDDDRAGVLIPTHDFIVFMRRICAYLEPIHEDSDENAP